MTFWAYMLHCRGGVFYAGHTDALERRIGDHQSGLIPGFTADHLPVEHVWSQEFSTRDEAKAAEKQIKGWSRAKKLALIRGDLARISTLAKGKDNPSTSSGQSGVGARVFRKPVRPELVEGLSFSLHPHQDTPAVAVDDLTVKMRFSDGLLWLNYEVRPAGYMHIPAPQDRARAQGLWQTTCFELFVASGTAAGYSEFNFSPSSRWAAYRFSAYREGMKNRTMTRIPEISVVHTPECFSLSVALAPDIVAHAASLALAAVIEEVGGTKSYWALAHPPGKPDFHHPTCFAATLAPPDKP